MRKMGGEKFQSLASMLLSKDDLENLELTQKQFTKNITRAQKEIEGWYFGIRKHLFDYDSVVDKQRKRVYHIRDEILMSEDDEEMQKKYVESFEDEFLTESKNIILTQITSAENTGQSVSDLLILLNKEFGLNITQPEHAELSKLDYETLKAALLERLDAYFTRIFDTLDTKILFQIFREVHLHFLDKLWVDHIDEMSNLREKVGLMSYAQMDPLVIYKKESFEKFQELLANIINNTASYLLKLDFDAIATQQQAVQLIQEENNQEKVIEILSSASRNMGAARKAVEQKKVAVANEEDSRAKIFENNDDYEVFEVVDADEKPEQKVVKPQ
jgi:preprotein translocase subunit SecA